MRDSDCTVSIVPKDDDQVANATPSLKQSDLHAAMASRLEQANALAHHLAQERARVDFTAHRPSADQQTPMETIHRATAGDRPSFGRPILRVFLGVLLASCIGVAAIAWQTSYGDAVKQMIGGQQSQFAPTSSQSLVLQPSPPTVQADAAKASPPQPALQARTLPEDAPRSTTALPPELTQLLQSMARDLTGVGQAIEQLKASQEQLAAVITNASERNPRSRRSAPLPQPIPQTQERALIVGMLTDNKDPMTPTELATATGQSTRNIRQLLNKMAKSGEISKHGTGRYGLQPKPGNNDNADKSGPMPALPSPQATEQPETEKQLSSPPPIPVRQ